VIACSIAANNEQKMSIIVISSVSAERDLNKWQTLDRTEAAEL
jgi:hypothetical protein